MSGFAGVFHLDGAPVDPAWLQTMAQCLAFRGPDGSQMWRSGNAGLCHTHLRTSAETDGRTQIATLDNSSWIAGDVRIDDRDLLIAKLSHGSDDLQTACSKELILHAYARWGEACVDHFLGDFSFVIWDARRRRVFAARDHLGVKPFFYAQAGECLVVSNTLDCIRHIPIVSGALNESCDRRLPALRAEQESGHNVFHGDSEAACRPSPVGRNRRGADRALLDASHRRSRLLQARRQLRRSFPRVASFGRTRPPASRPVGHFHERRSGLPAAGGHLGPTRRGDNSFHERLRPAHPRRGAALCGAGCETDRDTDPLHRKGRRILEMDPWFLFNSHISARAQPAEACGAFSAPSRPVGARPRLFCRRRTGCRPRCTNGGLIYRGCSGNENGNRLAAICAPILRRAGVYLFFTGCRACGRSGESREIPTQASPASPPGSTKHLKDGSGFGNAGMRFTVNPSPPTRRAPSRTPLSPRISPWAAPRAWMPKRRKRQPSVCTRFGICVCCGFS